MNQDGAWGRVALMLGNQKIEQLKKSRVLVVGLGAVGSFAIEALARSGIGHLRIVDFDQIKPSNINRQLYALRSTIGQKKIDIATQRIHDIYPEIEVDARDVFCGEETVDSILESNEENKIDYVIDAIDSVNPKVELISATISKNIPIISSMGAAGRLDPTQLRCTDISEVHGCTLSRHVRKKLHRRGIRSGFYAVWSEEPFQQTLNIHDSEMENLQEEEFFRKGRPRDPLPTLVFVPATVGMILASHVVKVLTEEQTPREEKDNQGIDNAL